MSSAGIPVPLYYVAGIGIRGIRKRIKKKQIDADLNTADLKVFYV